MRKRNVFSIFVLISQVGTPNSVSAPPHTPLGELSALPQTPYLDLRGPTFKGKEGTGREGGGKGPKGVFGAWPE